METVLQTYGLTKQYGSFTALSNLDLALERGTYLSSLLGPNGRRKNNIYQALLWTYSTPTAGDVLGIPRNAYWRGN